MKKHILTALTIAAVLFLTACDSTTSISGESPGIVEDIGDTMPLKIVTENFESELNELKTKSPDNIDWSGAIGFPVPVVSECYAVRVSDTHYEIYPDKVMTVEEQLAQFESYCKSYLGEYNPENACFDTKNRELLGEEYKIEGIDGVMFTAFPKINEYKDQILSGIVHPTWYLYVDNQNQMYLWWSAETMIYPHWYNKGETLRMLDKYYIAYAAIPTRLGEPFAAYPNDGSHNNEKYHLADSDVTIGEALDYFNNDYLKSLGIAENDIQKPAVRYINVYRITEDTYAYAFIFTMTACEIPFDWTRERSVVGSNKELFSPVSSEGQALMINKNDIDWAVGVAPSLFIKSGKPITDIISFSKSAEILSENISPDVLFRVVSADLVMTASNSRDNPDPLLMPTWKFTLQNDNDGFLYDFYIDAVSGRIDGYVRYNNY